MQFDTNDSRTPLERIDGALLEKIIACGIGDSRQPSCDICGRNSGRSGRQMNPRTDVGCRCTGNGVGKTGGCGNATGCENSNTAGYARERAEIGMGCAQDRTGNSGCGRDRTENSGCSRVREETGTGCGSDRTGNSGCGRVRTENTGCGDTNGCGDGGQWGLNGYPLAMVYSATQDWDGLYEPCQALERGTLFSSLDLPIKTAGGGHCNA